MLINMKHIKTIFRKSKIASIISLMILFQSCYTYREVSSNAVISAGSVYKIKQNSQQRKVRIIAVKDSSLVVEDKNGQREISKSEIDKMKIKKFDNLLTRGGIALLSLVVLAALVANWLAPLSF